MAIGMCLLPIGARVLRKEIRSRTLLRSSFFVTVTAGYVTEIWDTVWTWYDGEPLVKAVDVGDYVAITVGVVATVLLYLWMFQRTASKEAS